MLSGLRSVYVITHINEFVYVYLKFSEMSVYIIITKGCPSVM